MRCAKCLTVWFHAVSEQDVSPDQDRDEASVIVEADGRAVTQASSAPLMQSTNRSRLALAVVLGALTIFFGTFFWAALAFRHEIATVWPQSESFYALINLPVNVQGLAFEEITQDRLTENGESVLQISGRVINVSDGELTVPAIHVSLRDMQEREIYGWNFNAGVATLGPGQWSHFSARLPNPPAETARTEISFASGAGR